MSRWASSRPEHGAMSSTSTSTALVAPGAATATTSTTSTTATATVTLQVAGQTLMLLPEKAVFLPDVDTLLVADAHLGKATSFRQLGVPVPAGTTDETLAALTRLIRRLEVKRVVFLGDLLHSARSLAPDTLAAVLRWRELHGNVELTLVRGNHDDHAGDPPALLDIQAFDEPVMLRGLAFAHHPRPMAGAFVLAGHLHPCISVGGRAHDWHRLPCFWFSQRVGVLPAFGAFTGMHPVRVRAGERVFATGAGRVFELQPKLRRARLG
jgi:uncharacterized protein